MKRFFIVFFASVLAIGVFAQNEDAKQAVEDYMRSSLYTIILDDHGLMDNHKATIIKDVFFNTPLPEKFNDHNLMPQYRTFNPAMYEVTDAELEEVTGKTKKGKSKGGFGKSLGKFAKNVANDATAGIVDTTDTRKLPVKFMKFFIENHIPNRMIAKWYNQSDYNPETNSCFDMELIKERGLYNATEFDKSIAEKSTRGLAMLADAGENLIKNTFVVGMRFNYISKEELAQQLSETSTVVTGLIGGKAAAITDAAVQVGSTVAGKGYVIKATAFLYQLDWNEEVANTFYNTYYNMPTEDEFFNSDLFKLKYVGSETSWADIQSTVFSKMSEDDLLKRATVRAIDNVIAKLQKEHEAFRTKTPLLTTDPEITAQIGLKEGLEEGDKYEVLEKIQDPETNIVTYKRVTTIKVDKKRIWDNRYAADIEQAENAANNVGEIQTINATYFTGSNKDIYPGMLIRQIN